MNLWLRTRADILGMGEIQEHMKWLRMLVDFFVIDLDDEAENAPYPTRRMPPGICQASGSHRILWACGLWPPLRAAALVRPVGLRERV